MILLFYFLTSIVALLRFFGLISLDVYFNLLVIVGVPLFIYIIVQNEVKK